MRCKRTPFRADERGDASLANGPLGSFSVANSSGLGQDMTHYKRPPCTRTLIAGIAASSLVAAGLFATPAAAEDSTDQLSETTEAALEGLAAATDAVVDGEAFTEEGEVISDEVGTVTVEGTVVEASDFAISLPTGSDLTLDATGAATSVDSASGLGVVVAPVEGGSARILTVADEDYSADSTHSYEYQLELQPGTELRQLDSGAVVIVDVTGTGSQAEAALTEGFELPAEVDAEDYAAGIAQATEGVGADDPALQAGEVVVGGFLDPWSVDANGEVLPTRYEVDGESLIQVVDTENAAFPVVADPAPLIVFGLLAAGRALAGIAARAFATTTIRAGLAMTTRGGFTSFARFKTWAGPAKPGYQWHHIVEQGNRAKFPQQAIHHPRNLIQVPTAIHQRCINSWMARKFTGSVAGFAFRNTQTVRQQVYAMSWTSQHKFGVQLLRHCGVNI
jgi:hypothetical protein